MLLRQNPGSPNRIKPVFQKCMSDYHRNYRKNITQLIYLLLSETSILSDATFLEFRHFHIEK